jgi:hypothetical protein
MLNIVYVIQKAGHILPVYIIAVQVPVLQRLKRDKRIHCILILRFGMFNIPDLWGHLCIRNTGPELSQKSGTVLAITTGSMGFYTWRGLFIITKGNQVFKIRVELPGKSFNIPVTFKSSLLSKRTFC